MIVLSVFSHSESRGIKMAATALCDNCTLNIHYVVCRTCFKQYAIDAEKCPKCGEPNYHQCPRCWTSFKLA